MEHNTAMGLMTGILHNLEQKKREFKGIEKNDYQSGYSHAYDDILEYLHEVNDNIRRYKNLHDLTKEKV